MILEMEKPFLEAELPDPEERLIEIKDKGVVLARINTLFFPQSEKETPIPGRNFVLVGGSRTSARNIKVIARAFARFAPTLAISQPEASDSWIPEGTFNQESFLKTGLVQLEIIRQ